MPPYRGGAALPYWKGRRRPYRRGYRLLILEGGFADGAAARGARREAQSEERGSHCEFDGFGSGSSAWELDWRHGVSTGVWVGVVRILTLAESETQMGWSVPRT